MSIKISCVAGAIIAVIILAGCDKLLPKAYEENEILDGPLAGLSPEQLSQFINGDIAFNDEVFTPQTGLGPLFVGTSCGTCHAGDGKGHPFTTLTRFGQTDSTGNLFLHTGGPQLQHHAIPSYQPEYMPAGTTHSNFTPPANTGLGFLDAVTDETIIATADPNDNDADGISGVPNWIHLPSYGIQRNESIVRQNRYIGRFGKKAAVYDLLQQTANAYNQDIGITSTFEPYDTYTGLETDPEVSNQTILNVVFYLKTLKAPLRRNATAPNVLAGEKIFMSIDCAKCHLPTMRTGRSPVEALSFKNFSPYTDLLLHDMGPKLDDGYTEGMATTSEWRTPALWGLGLSKKSQGGSYFLLHDGRANSIEAAILLHGGEAERSASLFNNLSPTDQQNLILFLESL